MPRALVLRQRNTSSARIADALDARGAVRSRLLHLAGATSIPTGNPPTTLLLARIDRPGRIVAILNKSEQANITGQGADVLISQDDQLDSNAALRDTHLSGRLDGNAGFVPIDSARRVRIDFPLPYYPCYLKLYHVAGTTNPTNQATELWVELT